MVLSENPSLFGTFALVTSQTVRLSFVITLLHFHPRLEFYAKSFSPLPCLPISQTSQTLHTVPLYLEWYFEPSKAHSSYAVPL